MRLKAIVPVVLTLAVAFGASAASSARAEEPLEIVVLGDSLVAGYQLGAGEDYPSKLQAALRDRGYQISVINAGVSGDTTSGGLARVDWSVPDGTDGVILELGANDALRGIDPENVKTNLTAIIDRLKLRGIPVMLMGMLAPPNMGSGYGEQFTPIYGELAERDGLVFYPFILDGVTTHPDLQLADGMHPNAAGVDVMVENSLPTVERFLATIGGQTN